MTKESEQPSSVKDWAKNSTWARRWPWLWKGVLCMQAVVLVVLGVAALIALVTVWPVLCSANQNVQFCETTRIPVVTSVRFETDVDARSLMNRAETFTSKCKQEVVEELRDGVGTVIFVTVELEGLEERELPVYWSLHRAEDPMRSSRVSGEVWTEGWVDQLAWPCGAIDPTNDHETVVFPIWIQDPPANGPFRVVGVIGQGVDGLQAARFESEPFMP